MWITEFTSRKAPKGKRIEISWEDLVARLMDPVYTNELLDEYSAMTNEQKTEIKDVGGYVGGTFKNDTRRKNGLESRCILTIDADDADDDAVESFRETCAGLEYYCHSTHSSTPDQIRLRWLFPLSRPITAEEYKVVAGRMVSLLKGADDTTDQPERLMFWPSVSLDGEYISWSQRGEELDVDSILDKFGAPDAKPVKEPENIVDGALTIPEGQRNRTVFGFAATLRGQGLDSSGIRSMLEDYNDRYCIPPLPAEELDTITRSVCGRYRAGDAVLPTLRDAWDDFNDLGEWKPEAKRERTKMVAESMASLSQRHIEAPRYVIPDLIPYGLTILASPPKFGKSWMCLDLGISVATGTEFMEMPVNQCGVIYMALEDGDYRLQDRGNKVAGLRERPENLFFVKEATPIADGFISQLNELIDSCGGIGMVMVDTLQKIRGTAKKTEGVYGYDYRELGELQRYAIQKGIALVLVHHLNKGGDDTDFVSRLNGSTGVAGAADSIITLTRKARGSEETKMSVTGRDVRDRNIIIKMDWGRYRWMMLGEERDVAREKEQMEFEADPIVRTILWKLDDAKDFAEEGAEKVSYKCTTADLIADCANLFGIDLGDAVSVGRRLKNKLLVKLKEKEGISYEHRVSKTARTHIFTTDLID